MEFGIKTLDDVQVSGKTVLLRVDINEPVDHDSGTLKDISRIRACVPTVVELMDGGARLVLLAHQGSDIEYKNFYTTKPHQAVLEKLTGKKIGFIDDVCGPAAREAIANLKDGEALLLDNVRFCSEEQTLFEMNLKLTHAQQAKTQVVEKLAPLADLYVCDAFAAAHRDQPSLCGFEQVLPSCMGRLFGKEYTVISKMMESPERPCVFVLGGAKISDAFMMMQTVLKKGTADKVLTGGLVSNIMLLANGNNIGKASLAFIEKAGYEKYIGVAKELLSKYKEHIVLPADLAYVENGKRKEAAATKRVDEYSFVDIGQETVERYTKEIEQAKTVFVNGPMGIFEEPETEYGTKKIWEALANTSAYTIVGGGDSVTATNKYGLQDKIGYICTGGGALIRFLTGDELPVVAALRHAAQKFA
ncbi:MAG: phosphoglycerate kinase [Christensenellaceae bacterium]